MKKNRKSKIRNPKSEPQPPARKAGGRRAYRLDQRELAFELFCQDLTLPEIKKELRKKPGFATLKLDTICAWRDRDNWLERRKAFIEKLRSIHDDKRVQRWKRYGELLDKIIEEKLEDLVEVDIKSFGEGAYGLSALIKLRESLAGIHLGKTARGGKGKAHDEKNPNVLNIDKADKVLIVGSDAVTLEAAREASRIAIAEVDEGHRK